MGETTKTNAPPVTGGDLASALEPHLRKATQGRLGEIEWFRAAWQRSESSTGFATYELPGGGQAQVLVKLPVGPREYRWSQRLGQIEHKQWPQYGHDDCPVPRMIDGGDAINGYDLCWMVEERLTREASESPLTKDDLLGVIGAAARFQAAALKAKPVDEQPKQWEWLNLIERSRDALDTVRIPNIQSWNGTLKKFQKIAPAVARDWEARPQTCWCHGDLHPGNAMRRGDEGPWVLVDLALVHAGHWVEDAVYLERQYWHRKEDLCGVKPVSAMARARKELGLSTEGDHAELANLRRVLMASCVPAFAYREGSASYCDAALELLERLIPVVPHT